MSKIKKINYSKRELSKMLIHPDKQANKYSRGICYVIAGSKFYPGAAILTSRAAQVSGSGYTSLFTAKDNVLQIACSIPSCVVSSFEKFNNDFNETKNPTAYVVGPGFDPYKVENEKLILNVLKNTNNPILLDGGALACLINKDVQDILKIRFDNNRSTILTPHMGEANNIWKSFHGDKIDNQIDLAIELSELYKSIIVLKGPETIVCDGRKYYKMTQGSAALAKAGSGDVLSGIIGGLLCQNKLSSFECCVLGVNLHAIAGNLAAKTLSDVSVLPEDIIKFLTDAVKIF